MTQHICDMKDLIFVSSCTRNASRWVRICCAHSYVMWLIFYVTWRNLYVWMIQIGAQGMLLCGCGFVARIPATLCHFGYPRHTWGLQISCVHSYVMWLSTFICLNNQNRCSRNASLWLWICCAHSRRSLPCWLFPPQLLPADLLRTFICDVTHIL